MNYNKKTVKDIDVKGKKVLCRCDFNVPQDQKTGEPINPVEVTTGLSDGETVEILTGLASGDTVFYAYYDTLEESDAVEIERIKMY